MVSLTQHDGAKLDPTNRELSVDIIHTSDNSSQLSVHLLVPTKGFVPVEMNGKDRVYCGHIGRWICDGGGAAPDGDSRGPSPRSMAEPR